MENNRKIDAFLLLNELHEVINSRDRREIWNFIVCSLNKIKSELADAKKSKYSVYENDCNYISGIFMRSILDYMKIEMLTSSRDWIKDKKNVEQVWLSVWDCKDRIDFCRERVHLDLFDKIDYSLKETLRFYREQFGPGAYMSPELKVLKRNCSICKDNIKKCSHLSGVIYNGSLCSEILIDVELIGGSLVSYPRDHRCRAWPWRIDENGKSEVLFISTYCIGDFLDNDDWFDLNSSCPW